MSEIVDFYVRQLENNKAELEQQIEELRREVAVINNLIYRRKSQSFAKVRDEKINKKNVDRLFYESLIADLVKTSSDGLRTSEIHTNTEKMGYNINYNTLRSYVADMRDKGIIKKNEARKYHWVLA